MVGIGGGLGLDGAPVGLGAEPGGVATGDAFLYAEQQLVEWSPPSEVLLSAEQQLAEWSSVETILTAEHVLVEWSDSGRGDLSAEQQLVDWAPAPEALITAETVLVEWGDVVYGSGSDTVAGFSSASGNVVRPHTDHLPVGYGGPTTNAREFFQRLVERWQPKPAPAKPKRDPLPQPVRGRGWADTITGSRAIPSVRPSSHGAALAATAGVGILSARAEGSGYGNAGLRNWGWAMPSVRPSAGAQGVAVASVQVASAGSRAFAEASSELVARATGRLTRNVLLTGERDDLALLFADDGELSLIFEEES